MTRFVVVRATCALYRRSRRSARPPRPFSANHLVFPSQACRATLWVRLDDDHRRPSRPQGLPTVSLRPSSPCRLVIDVLPWSRVALASSGSRTVSPTLPSLACPMHSPSNHVLWGALGVTLVASSPLDLSVRQHVRALDVLRRPVSMRGRLRCRRGHLGCSVRRDPSYELPRL